VPIVQFLQRNLALFAGATNIHTSTPCLDAGRPSSRPTPNLAAYLPESEDSC